MSTSRKRRSAANTAIFLSTLLGAVILVNLISAKRFGRLDLTEDGQYTLSDASKSLVGGLDRPLVIKAYFSAELQPPDHTLEQRVRDLLEEYRAYSGGNLSFEIKNPEDTEDDKDEAGGFGIHPVRSDFQTATKVELRSVYKGIAFVYQDQQEVLAALRPSANLEYEFSQAIKRVTTDDAKKVVGFLGGHGELVDMNGVQRALNQIFGELYEIRPVNVDDGKPVPEDVSALVVINPQQMLPEPAKYQLDQFLMRGGSVALFLATQAQDRRFPIPRAQPVITGLEPLLSQWGVTVGREIILDRKNSTQMLVPTAQGLMLANNPVAFITTDLSREHIITKALPALSLPYSSPLTISDELKSQTGGKVEVLIRSMAESTARAQLSDTSPDALFKPQPGEKTGPFDVAVAAVGQFKSFYADKAPPAEAAAGGPPRAASPAEGQLARLFVMGNGEFLVQQSRLQRTSVVFLQNLVDWLASDEALIAIRSRGGPRPLEPVEASQQTLLTYANVLGVPLLFILFGLLRWLMRRNRTVELFTESGGNP